MKFKINNRTWIIKEVNQDKMQEIMNNANGEGFYYGITKYPSQEIYLYKGLHQEQKRQTLIHELMHCYLGAYVSFQTESMDVELVCDIVGNSHDIINKIVDKYFKDTK